MLPQCHRHACTVGSTVYVRLVQVYHITDRQRDTVKTSIRWFSDKVIRLNITLSLTRVTNKKRICLKNSCSATFIMNLFLSEHLKVEPQPFYSTKALSFLRHTADIRWTHVQSDILLSTADIDKASDFIELWSNSLRTETLAKITIKYVQ